MNGQRIGATRRQTLTLPTMPVDGRLSTAQSLGTIDTTQRRLSIVSQAFIPNTDEYRSQERVPPAGADFKRQLLLRPIVNPEGEQINQRRLSVISEDYDRLDDEDYEMGISDGLINRFAIQTEGLRRRRRILFFIEPAVAAMILLPVVTLFWESGWNLTLILLNILNGYSSMLPSNDSPVNKSRPYSFSSLSISYAIVQILLLLFYLAQDFLYGFLKRQKLIPRLILLKLHIFILSSIYIVQWVVIWTAWDQYSPREWYFEIVLSFTALFALIVFIGHLSDLVCAPFLVSYDSIEYCIHFGCPLLTRQMTQWKINLINYIVYEVIIANITILVWRGFYDFLDEHFYANKPDKAAWICLLIGYVLYYPLMYFQHYLEYLNLKFDFWVFVSLNFPQLYRNIRHFFAFVSCVLLWRGFWVLYNAHLVIFKEHYQTYLFLYLLTFMFLTVLQTSSSINGPLNNMDDDDNQFFPLYPNCYLSTVVRKLSHCYIGFITIAYTLSVFAFICGILQLSYSLTYIEQVCQVKSNDVVPSLTGSYWRPSWHMTVTDRVDRTSVLDDGVIVGSNSYSSTWQALIAARKKKINQSYPCYRYTSYIWLGAWIWQWDEPTALEVFLYVLGFVVFLIIGTTLLRLRNSYGHEEQYRRKPRQRRNSYNKLQSTSI
ncbi:unnamed protein product [Adineta ricciae]|uniref:Transmembrane protein n=1 Tax=Adineta ricciae TaxID=249248 RepID=A0A814ZK29_ADIRI|nr:unnamed protein product [Adineta ricciae]